MTGQNSHRSRAGGVGDWSSKTTSCPSGKWTYVSRAGAKRHAKKVGDGLRPYRCDFCPYWHVGHKPDVTMRGEMSAQEFHSRRVRYAYPSAAGPVDVPRVVPGEERDRARDREQDERDDR